MNLIVALLVSASFMGFVPFNSLQKGASDSSDLEALAQSFIELLVARDFPVAERMFDDAMKNALPEAKLRDIWDALVAQTGAYKKRLSTTTELRGGYRVLIVTSEFEKASIDVQVVFDNAKLVTGLFFRPARTPTAYAPPSYVNPKAFSEREVTIGTGEWALPGTLTQPVGSGSSPAVILVHGSGPHDRDESIGPNKTFRDLAWGLASKGVAVLRYEKRTKQHGEKLGSLKGLTVKEETIDDLVAAVRALRETEGVNGRIFVLGHSLGGMLVPRIGNADPSIAGFIILAGASRPLEDVILEQSVYLFSADGVISKEEETQLEGVKQLVAKVKGLQPSDVDSSLMLLGAPASYWLDLRGYDPPEMAKGLTQPILILQGERDYQVTMTDFHRWQNALGSKKNVTFKSYPGLNHLFSEGSGKSVPAEYNVPGHVAEVVIIDIADWVKSSAAPH